MVRKKTKRMTVKTKIDTTKAPRWAKKPLDEDEFLSRSGIKRKVKPKIPEMIDILKEDEYTEKAGIKKIMKMTERAKKIGGGSNIKW